MTACNLFARTCAQLYCCARGDKTMRVLRTLERNQWVPRSELDEITHRELRRLIQHAASDVPYYKKVFAERGLSPSDIGCVADLQKLPVLTKQIIRDNHDQLICPAYRRRLKTCMTSGSTAEPMKFALAPEVKQWGNAAKLRAWRWAGYQLGDKQFLLWSSSFDLKRLFSLGNRIRRAVSRVFLFDGLILSDRTCREYVDRLRRLRPSVLLGYANSLYLLASYINRNGIRDIAPRSVLSAAETLLPHMRAAMEKAFQCKVYDGYGSRETSLVSLQCEQIAGYHVSSDTTVMEIVKDGKPAAPGELGKVLLTDLKNFGMPFIRYQIEDVAVAGDQPCPCGRSLPTFRSVEGRMSHIVTLADGSHLNPLFLMFLMHPYPVESWGAGERSLEGVVRYQIVQESLTDFIVKIVRLPGTQVDLSYIAANFKKHVSAGANVQLDFVDNIPVPASGKRQVIVSKVPLEI